MSDGGATSRLSATVSTAGDNPSTIQTRVPLVNSVEKSAAQGVQQAVNQQFAAMLQQQQEILQRIMDHAPVPGPVSSTVVMPSNQGPGRGESVATTASCSTRGGSAGGMFPASAIKSVPLITQPTQQRGILTWRKLILRCGQQPC